MNWLLENTPSAAPRTSSGATVVTRAGNAAGLIRGLDLRGRLAFVQGDPARALTDYQEAAGHVVDYWSRISSMSVLQDWAILQLKTGAPEDGLATLHFVSTHPFSAFGSVTYRDRRRARRVLDHYREAEPDLVNRAEARAVELSPDLILDQLRRATAEALQLKDGAAA